MHVSAGIIAVGAMIVPVVGWMMPVGIVADDADAARIKPAATANDSSTRTQAKVALQPLMRICGRDWRKPFADNGDDAAANTGDGPSAQQVFMNLRLIGTVIETGHSMAIFQKPDGSVSVCAEGGRMDEGGTRVTVNKIVGTVVTVSCGGQTQTLAMPKPSETPQ